MLELNFTGVKSKNRIVLPLYVSNRQLKLSKYRNFTLACVIMSFRVSTGYAWWSTVLLNCPLREL